MKFAHLAEKSGKGSISDLSTKVCLEPGGADHEPRRGAPGLRRRTRRKATPCAGHANAAAEAAEAGVAHSDGLLRA